MKKLILFDMDGTIVESETHWRQAPHRLLISKGILIPRMMFERYDELRTMSGIRALIDAGIITDMSDEEAFRWCMKDMEKLYAQSIELKPGAMELLRYIHDTIALPMILVTATSQPSVDLALKRLGIYNMFDQIISTFHQSLNKGDQEFYQKLSASYGCLPSDCLLLDDSLYALKGAGIAGLETWAVEEEVNLLEKDEIIQTADRYFTDCYEILTAFQNGHEMEDHHAS